MIRGDGGISKVYLIDAKNMDNSAKFIVSNPYQDFSTCRLYEIQKEAEAQEDYEKCQQIQEELIERIKLSDLV